MNLKGALLTASALFFFVTEAFAIDSATVIVEAAFTPSSATGLLLSSNGTIEKMSPELQKESNGRYLVKFPISGSEISEDTVATAMVSSKEGAVAFGNIVVVGSGSSTKPLPPLCKEKEPSPADVTGFSGMLASLVEIRNARREIAKKKVASYLSGESQDNIQALETSLGLARGKPLGPELNAYELVDRLSRLLASMETYYKIKRNITEPFGYTKSEDPDAKK